MAKDKDTNTMHGKPWKTDSSHDSFIDADTRRHKLLETSKFQVKVRRTTNDTFDVKVRTLKSVENTKAKKKRPKRKNM